MVTGKPSAESVMFNITAICDGMHRGMWVQVFLDLTSGMSRLVPGSLSGAMLFQVALMYQLPQMQFDGISIYAKQRDRVRDCNPSLTSLGVSPLRQPYPRRAISRKGDWSADDVGLPPSLPLDPCKNLVRAHF